MDFKFLYSEIDFLPFQKPNYLDINIIFDVKLGEGFRRKARFVGDGHKTETPSSVTYSSVVSRDSIRIILMIAALNLPPERNQ